MIWGFLVTYVVPIATFAVVLGTFLYLFVEIVTANVMVAVKTPDGYRMLGTGWNLVYPFMSYMTVDWTFNDRSVVRKLKTRRVPVYHVFEQNYKCHSETNIYLVDVAIGVRLSGEIFGVVEPLLELNKILDSAVKPYYLNNAKELIPSYNEFQGKDLGKGLGGQLLFDVRRLQFAELKQVHVRISQKPSLLD